MTRCKNLLFFTLLGSTLMLAQACDQSSKNDPASPKKDLQNAIDVDVDVKGDPQAPLIDNDDIVNGDVPSEPGVIPPPGEPIPDLIPGNGPGYGGGSQGFLPPLDAREEDDDGDHDEEPIPDGNCGNNVQEVLPNLNKHCPHFIYGTTINENNTSDLVFLDKNTGAATFIAEISGLTQVSAIDFSPDGRLFAVGFADVDDDDDDDEAFAEIDCATGTATIIGDTLVDDLPPIDGNFSRLITDITFDSQGQLWAFLEDQRIAGRINEVTGEFLPVSTDEIIYNDNDDGDGLTFWPFFNNNLYDAGDTNIVLIDQTTGVGTSVHALQFPLNGLLINATDNDPFSVNPAFNTTYVSLRLDDSASYLGTLNMASGVVSFISDPPLEAPYRLDAIAVNRIYEECDGSAPDGADCVDCQLVEINCSDNVDNDGNGAIDCDDPACRYEPCNDGSSCTTNDTCLPPADPLNADGSPQPLRTGPGFLCQGTDALCNDHDPCSENICCDNNPDALNDERCPDEVPVPPDGPSPFCIFPPDLEKTSFGSCEVDGHACTVGKCAFVDPPTQDDDDSDESLFICVETDRKFIFTEVTIGNNPIGCNDGDECTADSCSESWVKEGYESNGNVNSIIEAAVPWGSVDNVDEDGNVLLDNDFQCLNEVQELTPCVDDASCHAGVCTLQGSGMPGDAAEVVCAPPALAEDDSCSDESSQCLPLVCDDVLGCIPDFPLPGLETPCDTDDLCYFKNCDGSGTCIITNDKVECDGEPAICNYFTCVDGDCVAVAEPDGEPSGRGDCSVSIETGRETFGECDKGSFRCFGGEEICEPLHTATAFEICFDGLDNNCNGFVDEGCPRIVFITETQVAGTFGSVAEADRICQTEATDNNRPGTYKAWISDSLNPPHSPITDPDFIKSTIPYATVDGTIVANSFAAIIANAGLLHPINVAADGEVFSSPDNLLVWTGTNSNGAANTNHTCSSWTGTSVDGYTGSAEETDSDWTFFQARNCQSQQARFYCFQQAAAQDTGGCAGTPAQCINAKVAFISQATRTNGFGVPFGGTTTADNICRDEAAAASLPGTFRAWISDGLTSPNTGYRAFVRSLGPYILTDTNKTIIAANYTGLTSGSLLHKIDRDAMGNLVANSNVWTGTLPNGSYSGSSCQGWLNLPGFGTQGNSGYVDGNWTSFQDLACGTLQTARFYCFEQ